MKQRLIRENYKWVIAAVCFLTVMIGLGFCSGLKGAYLKTVSESLAVSRTAFSVNEIVRYATTAAVNLVFAVLVVKLGAKRMMLFGVAALICSMLLYAAAPKLANAMQLYPSAPKLGGVFTYGAIYGGGFFLGLGLAWCTTTMVGYVIGKWFTTNRGTVMGVILAASGLGTATATRLLRPVLVSESYVFGYTGWRVSYLLSALALVVILVLLLVFFREPPKQLADSAPVKKRRGRQWVGMDWTEARKKPYFYIMVVCVFFVGLCLQSANGISIAHMEDVGLNSEYITKIASWYALVLCAAKMLAGVSYDKLGLRVTLLVSTLAGAGAIYLLSAVTKSSPGLALAYEMMIPFGLPMETVMLPLIAADMFGEKSFAKIMGLFVSVNTAGYAVGSLLSNAVFDWLGSYKLVLLLYAGILLAAAVTEQICLIPAARDREKILAADETE